jgi:hypothetical protein
MLSILIFFLKKNKQVTHCSPRHMTSRLQAHISGTTVIGKKSSNYCFGKTPLFSSYFNPKIPYQHPYNTHKSSQQL